MIENENLTNKLLGDYYCDADPSTVMEEGDKFAGRLGNDGCGLGRAQR